MPLKKDSMNPAGKKRYRPGYNVACMGVMLALLEVSKRALDFLPNIELVSFLFIIFTLLFGWRVLLITFAFSFLEGTYLGFGPWTIAYFYVWPILVILTLALKNVGKDNPLFWATLSGAFGLSFGFLCSFYTLAIGGIRMQLTWWIAGIPYDIIHCLGNFFICLFLFRPIYHVGKKLILNFET